MNYKIVVDPGHGGVDPGAVYRGLQEKDFNLQSSLYMYDRFNELGIPVKLTRNTDETLNKGDRIKRILNAFGNSNDVIVISNHINAGGGDGAEVVYALRNSDNLAKSVLNNIAKEGQNVRSYYQRRLPEDPTKDYYFIHRETGRTQPILVEYGFIDSPKDDISQLKNNLNDYAEAVVKSVAQYIGVPYKAPGDISSSGGSIYTVKKGDSLYNIANMFDVSVEDLKSSNDLSGNLITVGQKLVIPSNKAVDAKVYTVKRGDNLYSVASRFGVSVNDLISYNNLGTTVLQIGQQLFIPDASSGVDLPGDISKITYVVKSGDTLWSVAKKYNISVNDLKDANNLSSNLLSIGQSLVIPDSNNYKTYVVKSGDSLFKIAALNGVNLNDLIEINNLKSDLLSVGQTILIP